jgi:predicted phage tail protein
MTHRLTFAITMLATLILSACASDRSAPTAPSPQASIRTLAVTKGAAAAPAAPTGLTASSSGSNVTLTWVAPAGPDAPAAYMIEAGSTSGASNLANFSTGSTATTFSASGVPAASYYVRVRATNSSGTSAPSNEVLLVVGGSGPCTTAPGAPSGLATAFNSGGIVVLQWTAASGSPSSYVVEAGSSSGASDLVNSDSGSAATSFATTGVAAGTYYIRVRAKNGCGTSGPSNEIVLVVGGGSPTGGLTGRWIGVAPDGISVPTAACETAYDVQFDLTQNGTNVAGTTTLRVTAVKAGASGCTPPGTTFTLPLTGTAGGPTFVLRVGLPDNVGVIQFTGSFTSARLSGAASFTVLTSAGGVSQYSGTFAANKQ